MSKLYSQQSLDPGNNFYSSFCPTTATQYAKQPMKLEKIVRAHQFTGVSVGCILIMLCQLRKQLLCLCAHAPTTKLGAKIGVKNIKSKQLGGQGATTRASTVNKHRFSCMHAAMHCGHGASPRRPQLKLWAALGSPLYLYRIRIGIGDESGRGLLR